LIEKSGLVTLTCDEVVKDNPKFGPNFVGNSPNYKLVIAKCPSGCYKPSSTPTLGMGIHPEESSICRAAIVDRSIPLYGGIIGVNILTGLNKYEEGHLYHGIKTEKMAQSSKSFTTIKIDNVDFAESDIRILNADGESSSAGRLEFRQNGIWGTVCMKGMNDYAARLICRQLKYGDGRLVKEENKDTICAGYEGNDHCGADT